MTSFNTTTRKAEPKDNRFTLRLPGDLLEWVQQQGGSGFIRDLLFRRRAEDTLGSPTSGPTVSILETQWEYLAGEQSLLDLEREHRQDEERALARQQDLLDKERELLAERRELLQAGWQNLEEALLELEEQKIALVDALAVLAIFPHRLP
jgi:hypothetical protein